MALGPHLRDVPEESWKIFKEEKRQNMVSILRDRFRIRAEES
jgi:hypothetical protein